MTSVFLCLAVALSSCQKDEMIPAEGNRPNTLQMMEASPALFWGHQHFIRGTGAPLAESVEISGDDPRDGTSYPRITMTCPYHLAMSRSSTDDSDWYYNIRQISYNSTTLSYGTNGYTGAGWSVRCIRDYQREESEAFSPIGLETFSLERIENRSYHE